MKRIILGQGLSPPAATLLRMEGWDALHVLDVGLYRAEDSEILDFALRESRTCVTLDHDFHTHLARNRTTGPSMVFVRLEGLVGPEQADLIRKIWNVCEPGYWWTLPVFLKPSSPGLIAAGLGALFLCFRRQ